MLIYRNIDHVAIEMTAVKDSHPRIALAIAASLAHHALMKTAHLSTMLRAACASILLLAATACGTTPASTPAPAPGGASLAEQIKKEVGVAACDAPQQCQTVAIGAKACGGPERYLAWSNQRSDGKALTALAQAQAEASRKLLQSEGMLSTCAIVTDPGATCQAGRCVLNQAGATAM